jgi:hypothetical protein
MDAEWLIKHLARICKFSTHRERLNPCRMEHPATHARRIAHLSRLEQGVRVGSAYNISRTPTLVHTESRDREAGPSGNVHLAPVGADLVRARHDRTRLRRAGWRFLSEGALPRYQPTR